MQAADYVLQIIEIVSRNARIAGVSPETAELHIFNLHTTSEIFRAGGSRGQRRRQDAQRLVLEAVDNLAYALLQGEKFGYGACAMSPSIEINANRILSGDILATFKTECNSDDENKVDISHNLFGNKVGDSDSVDVHMITFKENIFDDERSDELITDVVRFNLVDAVTGKELDTKGPFDPPVRITITRNDNNDNENLDRKRAVCAYWDYDKDKWSTDGVTTIKQTAKTTVCEITHFTDFSVLLSGGDGDGDGSSSGSYEMEWDWIMITSLVLVGVAIIIVVIICVAYDIHRRRYHAKHDKILDSRLSKARSDSTIGGGHGSSSGIESIRSENV